MKLPPHFYFTQSKLQDYLDCPYRFYLRHILNLKWPALLIDDAAAFEERAQTGARFHRLIQQYLLGVPEIRLEELAAADINPEVATWWQRFLIHVPPWLTGQRFVETIITATLDEQRILAKYDLILLKDDGEWLIFDWKTSQNLPRKDWLLDRVQTRLYQWMLAKRGNDLIGVNTIEPEQISMQYWFATHPENAINLSYNQKMYQKDTVFFKNLIKEIINLEVNEFKRTLDLPKCRFCIYRSHCDRGVQAGELVDYENFFQEPENLPFEIDFDQIAEIQF